MSWRTVPAGLTLLVPPLIVLARSDPAHEWRTLSTDHFRVHHPQGGEALARRLAAIAEEAYARCRDEFGLVPQQVVEVVLTDQVDASNAFTRVYPYDHIEVLARPPGPDSELAHYDDPYRSLVYHEFAHVLHMDQVSGFPGLVNSVLGKTLLPNSAVPAWFSEGFATFVETRMTGGGRIGSAYYDMLLRTAALADDLLDLSELTEAPGRLPRGTAPYLYGSYFFDFLARHHGVERMTAFLRDYGRRVIPFALNHLARRHFGADFAARYDAFLQEVREEAERTLTRIHDEGGPLEGRAVTSDGEMKAWLVFGPDSRTLFYVASDGRTTPGIVALDIASGVRRFVSPCHGGCAGLERSGETLLTSHLEPYRTYSHYGDAFRVDPVTGQEERLTRRARAREPVFLPDGRLAFVSSEFDRVTIETFDPSSGQTQTLIAGGRFQGIGTPRAIPESHRLVFSGAQAGQWDLWVVDAVTGDLHALTRDRALDRDPTVSPDGRFVVFSSDADGIFNLYAIEVDTGLRYRVTRVLGGAFWPAVSPDGRTIAYASWSTRGYDIAVIPYPTESDPIRDPVKREEVVPYEPSEVVGTSQAYSPWPSLRPRAIKPRYYASSSGISRLGVEVAGQDAVGLHRFNALFESDTATWKPSGALSYAYERLFPTIAFDVATAPSSVVTFVDDRLVATPCRDYVLGLSLVRPMPWRDRSFSAGIAYSLLWSSGVSRPSPTDPASSQPRAFGGRRSAALTLFATHDSTEAYAWSISPEKGFSAGLSLVLRRRELGGEGDSVTLSGYLYEYLPMPWVSGHVLALLASGAWSRGDRGFESSYALGGLPRQDVIASILNRQPWNLRSLRGFPPDLLRGNAYGLLNVEYRLPLARIHRGLDTLPVVARRLFGTVFADVGGAFPGAPSRDDVRVGLGAEVALSGNLGLTFSATLRLGYGHGFGPGGRDVVYLLLTP